MQGNNYKLFIYILLHYLIDIIFDLGQDRCVSVFHENYMLHN